MIKLTIYVPKNESEGLLDALFDQGFGSGELYEKAYFASTGHFFYTPRSGSRPNSGTVGKDSSIETLKIEITHKEELTETELKNKMDEILKSHPYERPAYELTKIISYH